MGMTSEELTYQMAREQVNQWRQQLRRLNQRDGLDAWDRGMAEGLATAIREMDRVLDTSPIASRWKGMSMAEAMNREPDPATDEGYGPRAVND